MIFFRLLRLPPYHPELNPIELIWGLVKGRVARRNNAYNIQRVHKMTLEEIGRVTAEDWQVRIRRSVHEFYRYKEVILLSKCCPLFYIVISTDGCWAWWPSCSGFGTLRRPWFWGRAVHPSIRFWVWVWLSIWCWRWCHDEPWWQQQQPSPKVIARRSIL